VGRSVKLALVIMLLSAAVGCASTPFGERGIAGGEDGDLDPPAPAIDLPAVLKECYSADLGLTPKKNLKVNGHLLTSLESKNVQWIAHCIVPYLPGKLSDQAEIAAKTTWWSLREGVMDRAENRAFSYANCHTNEGGAWPPLKNCPSNIWQVGLPAGQVMNYSPEKIAEKISKLEPTVDPHIDEDVLVRWSASLAGYVEGTTEYRGIVRSTDRVRRSWLVRNPLVGFMLVAEEEVTGECLIDHHKWCTSGDYPSAVKYSHSRAGVLRAIGDLKRIYQHHLAD
jgi:hypothetical protein